LSLSFENIIYEKKDKVAKITLNRPRVLNALSVKTLKELCLALQDARDDEDIRVIVITGAGDRAFSAGFDIGDIKDKTPYEFRVSGEFYGFYDVIRILYYSGKPTIASVNGLALGGGCELACSADLIIASEKAMFGLPEINVGVFPGIAVAQLPRLIGLRKALELMYFGDMIPAKEAERIGLVNKVVPHEKLEEATKEYIDKLLSKSAAALRSLKSAVYRCLDMEYFKALAMAGEMLATHISSEDAKEGVTAFLEKRQPVWKGK